MALSNALEPFKLYIIAVERKFLALFYECNVSVMWEQEKAISENVSDKEWERKCTSYEENEGNEVDRRGRDWERRERGDRERRESDEAKEGEESERKEKVKRKKKREKDVEKQERKEEGACRKGVVGGGVKFKGTWQRGGFSGVFAEIGSA